MIEKGQEAIDGIMEISQESGSARAYEVTGQIIKSVADATDKLLDLQKKIKDILTISGNFSTYIHNESIIVT